jgi:imidazole glycerol-phosphate synthase subunit HisH
VKAVVLDYGAGNLHSIVKSLRQSGAEVRVERDALRLLDGDVLVLPGVGAFPGAAAQLAPRRGELRDALRAGHPCLAICLGMQLLFERSSEGPGDGIGLVRGDVERLTSDTVPHMGWNTLEDARDPALQAAGLDTAYFANSYACRPREPDAVTAWTVHENTRMPAALRVARTMGVQFHPEKSSRAGQAMIAAFLREVGA